MYSLGVLSKTYRFIVRKARIRIPTTPATHLTILFPAFFDRVISASAWFFHRFRIIPASMTTVNDNENAMPMPVMIIWPLFLTVLI